MDDEERARYHGLWWPDACQAKGWRIKDEVRRRDQVLFCMAEVRGPAVTTSHPDWGHDETTALRTYLAFVAYPTLVNSQRWLDCKQDYRAFNRARQADWHERKAYGPKGSGKFARNRFAGAKTAQGEPQETFDPKEARKRHMSMAYRNRQRTGYRSDKKQLPGDLRFVTMVGGQVVAGPAAPAAPQPEPHHAHHVAEDDDENCPF